jgi:hypothetical protein
MLTTFGQAKRLLAKHMGSASLSDPGGSINTACEELSYAKNWSELKRTVRLAVSGEWFALPQDYENVIRAAVNGVPSAVHGSDIEFLLSGPGDFDYATAGYAPVSGIQDTGWHASMYAPRAASTLAFFSTAAPAGKVRVTGHTAAGDSVTEDVAVNAWASVSDIDTMNPATVAVVSVNAFVDVTRVLLPGDASSYISLYGIASSAFTFLSRMHPSIKVPRFRRYRLPGFSTVEDTVYNVLAEVRLKFMPLVDDDDVLPFDSLLPVQYMLRSIWKMDAEDVKGADEYRMRAEASLVRRENTQEERACVVVVNSVYDGSPGQASNEIFDNL